MNQQLLIAPLMLSLVLVSRTEAQTRHWILVGKTADTTYYLDSTSVASRDRMIEVWTKSEFSRTIVERYGNL